MTVHVIPREFSQEVAGLGAGVNAQAFYTGFVCEILEMFGGQRLLRELAGAEFVGIA